MTQRLVAVFDRIAKGDDHSILGVLSNRNRCIQITLANLYKELRQRLRAALSLFGQQEEQSLQHHRYRRYRRHQQRPHDRTALLKDVHDVGLLYQRLQRTAAGWIKRQRSLT